MESMRWDVKKRSTRVGKWDRTFEESEVNPVHHQRHPMPHACSWLILLLYPLFPLFHYEPKSIKLYMPLVTFILLLVSSLPSFSPLQNTELSLQLSHHKKALLHFKDKYEFLGGGGASVRLQRLGMCNECCCWWRRRWWWWCIFLPSPSHLL